MKKSYLLLATTISFLGLVGCTSPSVVTTSRQSYIKTTHYEKPTPEKMAHYQQTMRTVASGIKHDNNYQRITLDTPEKKEWFRMLTYRLWDRQITRQQFMTEGLSHYPSHRYEFAFVIKGFESACK